MTDKMTKAQAATYEKAKTRFSELAFKLQHRLPAIECANIFVGSAIAILRAAGGDGLAEAYFSETLDDLRLDSSGLFDEQPPDTH